MALRLRGATSGYIELKAPASAGDNTLTLPTNNGSANQLLKTDGSGNLSWTDDNSGVSLSGSTDNTLVTVTGANALQGESVLTFDGNDLQVRPAKANLIVAKAGLTVKANSDLHTTYDFLQIGAGGAIASYSTETVTASTHFIHNAYRHSGGNWKRRYADTACKIEMNSPGGAIEFFSAVTGNADTDITWVQSLMVDSDGRVRIGNTTQNQYTAADDLIVGSGSGDRGLTLYSGSSDAGVIAFSDGTTDTAYRSGQIIYDHSADSMDFRTNGNYIRLKLTSTGQLEATSAADVRLTLGSSGTAGTNNSVHIRADSADLKFMAASGGDTIFETNGTETLRIDASGQLLLGSTANYGTIGTAAAFQIQGTNTGSNVSMNIVNAATSNASSTCDINAWQDYRLSTRIISGRENANNWTSSASGAASFLAFYTNNAGTVAEKFGITSNGSLQHFGGGTWASAKTTGDFKITVSNLTANAGNTWRKCGVFVMYNGINADATNSKSAVGYYGVGSVTNWSWFGEDEEFTADSLNVTLDNDTTTSFRLNFNVADNNTGSVNVFVNGDSAKPIVSIAA
jgi:Fe-S cluster assembly iron-binding protein IscA